MDLWNQVDTLIDVNFLVDLYQIDQTTSSIKIPVRNRYRRKLVGAPNFKISYYNWEVNRFYFQPYKLFGNQGEKFLTQYQLSYQYDQNGTLNTFLKPDQQINLQVVIIDAPPSLWNTFSLLRQESDSSSTNQKVFRKLAIIDPLEGDSLNFELEDFTPDLTERHQYSQRLSISTALESYIYQSPNFVTLSDTLSSIGGFNSATISLFNLLFGYLFSRMFLIKIGETIAKKQSVKNKDGKLDISSVIKQFRSRVSFESIYSLFDWADQKDQEIQQLKEKVHVLEDKVQSQEFEINQLREVNINIFQEIENIKERIK